MRLLLRERPQRILDAGSGAVGIGFFSSARYVGCDLCFAEGPATHMTPVRGSCAALPFTDSQFDLVVSLDMLEHVREQERARAIVELARVSRRWVVIGYPAGRRAWECDRQLAAFYQRRCGTPAWLREHLAAPFPVRSDVEDVLREKGLAFRVYDSEVIGLHRCIMMMEYFLLDRIWLRIAPLKRPSLTARRRLPTWWWSTGKVLLLIGALCASPGLGDPYRQIFIVDTLAAPAP